MRWTGRPLSSPDISYHLYNADQYSDDDDCQNDNYDGDDDNVDEIDDKYDQQHTNIIIFE